MMIIRGGLSSEPLVLTSRLRLWLGCEYKNGLGASCLVTDCSCRHSRCRIILVLRQCCSGDETTWPTQLTR
jgi:hypothetical protein